MLTTAAVSSGRSCTYGEEGWGGGFFTQLQHLKRFYFRAYLYRIILRAPPPLPSLPTATLGEDLTRGHFNNEDGLTAMESAHKLALQPTSMSNLPSS